MIHLGNTTCPARILRSRRSSAVSEDPLNETIRVRVSDADKQRLAQLVKKLRGLKESVVTRAALRLGMKILEENPSAIFDVDDSD